MIKNTGKTFEELLEEQLRIESGGGVIVEQSSVESKPDKKHQFLKKKTRV